MSIRRTIQAFHDNLTGDAHHRYRSWEHCYGYFQKHGPDGLRADPDHAALQLGFYLASRGMYRGSSFLLQRAYTVHVGVIEVLIDPRFSVLWHCEFDTGERDSELQQTTQEAVKAVKSAYRQFVPSGNSKQPTDTLATKVVLGALGCLPACDRFFIDGFKGAGYTYSRFNETFIRQISTFCQEHLNELRTEQERIGGLKYPLMKLADMHFWQLAYEFDKNRSVATKRKLRLS